MNSRTDLGNVPVEVETRPERKLFSVGRKIVSAKGASALRRESCPLFSVREADKPADADYPFGHAKMEAVAALAQTGFLAASIGTRSRCASSTSLRTGSWRIASIFRFWRPKLQTASLERRNLDRHGGARHGPHVELRVGAGARSRCQNLADRFRLSRVGLSRDETLLRPSPTFAFLAGGERSLHGIRDRPPVLIQTFRILGGVFLVRYFQGELPGVFAIPAGVGDVLTGLFALLVA
jgi:hypothetical protein